MASSHLRLWPINHVFASLNDSSIALLSREPPATRALVFVHGFAGDAAKTWVHFTEMIQGRSDWWSHSDAYFVGYNSLRCDIRGAAIGLLTFLRSIAPFPPPALFEYERWGARGGFRDSQTKYEDLYLIGHSLGGVLVRQAVRLAVREHVDKQRQGSSGPLLTPVTAETSEADFVELLKMARLRLFAPAIAGARPSGIKGLLQSAGFTGLIAWSRSYHELKETSPVLADLRSGTESLAVTFPDATAFRADIAWAERDTVVYAVEYGCDRLGKHVSGVTHTSICKPNPRYRLPVRFVEVDTVPAGLS